MNISGVPSHQFQIPVTPPGHEAGQNQEVDPHEPNETREVNDHDADDIGNGPVRRNPAAKDKAAEQQLQIFNNQGQIQNSRPEPRILDLLA